MAASRNEMYSGGSSSRRIVVASRLNGRSGVPDVTLGQDEPRLDQVLFDDDAVGPAVVWRPRIEWRFDELAVDHRAGGVSGEHAAACRRQGRRHGSGRGRFSCSTTKPHSFRNSTSESVPCLPGFRSSSTRLYQRTESGSKNSSASRSTRIWPSNRSVEASRRNRSISACVHRSSPPPRRMKERRMSPSR